MNADRPTRRRHPDDPSRFGPAQRLLRMALLLAGSRAGLSVKDLSVKLDVEIRSAQRMFAALKATFPELEEVENVCGSPRWRLPQNPLGTLASPRPETLAALEAAARIHDDAGERERADLLRQVAECIMARLTPKLQRLIEPDLDVLMEAEGTAMRPGPRSIVSPDLLSTLRPAIIETRHLKISYNKPGAPPRDYVICPYAVLRGGRNCLVAPLAGESEPRLWRTDRIVSAMPLETGFVRPEDFDMRTFAAESFGVYRQKAIDVVLRLSPEAAADAEGHIFHPSQQMTLDADGGMTVRFRAGGVWEMCWHFFRWGTGLTILAPDSLREEMAQFSQSVASHHAAVPISMESGSGISQSTCCPNQQLLDAVPEER